jgi:hypothetical protein
VSGPRQSDADLQRLRDDLDDELLEPGRRRERDGDAEYDRQVQRELDDRQ